MIIHYLGHAGFLIEMDNCRLIIDPWLSENGAFDRAWFQFPENHFLFDEIISKTSELSNNFLYITHEHKDHYDIHFISSLNHKNYTLLIPEFRRNKLLEDLRKYNWNNLIVLTDGQKQSLSRSISVIVYIDDSELSRDSAIIVKEDDSVFVNFNDFRKFDIISNIKSKHKQIDTFTCQFSGATWHPTCYEYTLGVYQEISKLKIINKFKNLIEAIKILSPKYFIPSAGPPCFLDPELFHINFQPINIFPKSFDFKEVFDSEINTVGYYEMMPGDKLVDGHLEKGKSIRIKKENYLKYLRDYQSKYKLLFLNRTKAKESTRTADVLSEIEIILKEKLDRFKLSTSITFPFYVTIVDSLSQDILKIDFINKEITREKKILEKEYYSISVHAYEIKQIIEKKLTFSDFSLSFRMKINRKPDVYQKLFHGFFLMETEDMEAFCESIAGLSTLTERCTISCSGKFYSIDKYCPHEKANLENAIILDSRFLICPRHGWKFDLLNNGREIRNNSTINSIELDDEA